MIAVQEGWEKKDDTLELASFRRFGEARKLTQWLLLEEEENGIEQFDILGEIVELESVVSIPSCL